ncbi:hypothetical protein [Paraclostridium sordellii]
MGKSKSMIQTVNITLQELGMLMYFLKKQIIYGKLVNYKLHNTIINKKTS